MHDGHCQYYVKSRHSFCKFTCVPNSNYCETHNPPIPLPRIYPAEDSGGQTLAQLRQFYGDAFATTRCACPVDGRHSIYLAQLWRHLKKCPRVQSLAREALSAYFAKNINLLDELSPLDGESGLQKDCATNRELMTGRTVEEIVSELMPSWILNDDPNLRENQSARRSRLGDEEADSRAVAEMLAREGWEHGWVQEEDAQEGGAQEGGAEEGGAEEGGAEEDEASWAACGYGRFSMFECWPGCTDAEVLDEVCRRLSGSRRSCDAHSVVSLCPKELKHEAQCVEIISRFRAFVGGERFDRLVTDADWIELGAGKGSLIRTVVQLHNIFQTTASTGAQAADSNDPEGEADGSLDPSASQQAGRGRGMAVPRFALVDRTSTRNAKEAKTQFNEKSEELARLVTRIKLDLADFDANKFLDGDNSPPSYKHGMPWILQILVATRSIPVIETPDQVKAALAAYDDGSCKAETPPVEVEGGSKKRDRPVVFLAKHLCGSGTDLAMRTFDRTRRAHPDRECYLVIAPCCYHACTESMTLGWEKTQLGTDVLKRVAGWSTGASEASKASLGNRLKSFLLFKRRAWLAARGYRTLVTRFCPFSVSKENLLLIAATPAYSHPPSQPPSRPACQTPESA